MSLAGRAAGGAAMLVIALAALPAPAADGAGTPATESAKPVPARSAWKRYVIDPGKVVYPKAVYVLAGSPETIRNTGGLKARGGGATTITSAGVDSSGVGVPALLLDLGANVGGYVEIGIRASSGAPIRLGYSETLDYMTPAGDVPSLGLSFGQSDDPDGRTDVFQVTGPAELRSPGIRGAQRLIALQLDGAGSASIDYVRVRTEHLHPSPRRYSGYFYSSDPLLNRIWFASAYTFAMNSVRDLRPGFGFSGTIVTDGAKRDRLIWAGDLGMENLVGNYALRSAPNILRRSLQAFSCLQLADGQLSPAAQIAVQCPRNPAPVPDASAFPATAQPAAGNGALRLPQYTAAWIIALRDYYFFTGDRRFAHRMMPVVRRALAYFLANLDGGLFRTPSDPMTINWHPPDLAGGIDAHTNASLYRALIAAAALERSVGKGRPAAKLDLGHAEALRGAILARLWDPQAGAFIGNTDDPLRNHTQDAQVEAILAGLTSPSRSQQALHFIDSNLLTPFGVANGQFDNDPYTGRYISPFISATEVMARFSLGDANGALNLIGRTWGRMLAVGPGTVWERMRLDGMPNSGAVSLAHGWSAGPVPGLSAYVLGIRPTAPGYRHWVVAPQPGYLRFAQGEAPTPRGPIASRWSRGGRSFKLTVTAPRDTSGVVELPVQGRTRMVARDGKVVWS
ncbi:MAG TPA: alpha-L-rhamnosidase C-terminal domain-containing protein, partial [Solirubrobacterales bacterium]